MNRKRKKVLFVIPSLKAGGAERITYLLATNLPREEFDISICALNKVDQFFEFNHYSHVKLYLWEFSKVGKSFWKLRHLINSEKPDVIFSMITHMNTLVGCMMPFINYKPKLILRETNVLTNIYNNNMGIKRLVRYHLNRFGYKKASIIVCQSHFMREDVINTLRIKYDKCTIIHNPVKSPNKEIEDHKFDLIALGNLTPIKGYDRLLEVMSLLKPMGLYLGIIGEGSERNKLEAIIASKNLSNHISLLGYIKNPSSYLQKAKMLVITSRFESFPNAVLEAGILGKPTVGFNVKGGLSEIIDDGVNGYLVEDGNIKLFSERVLEILNQPLNESQIKKLTSGRFGMDKIIKRYKSLLN